MYNLFHQSYFEGLKCFNGERHAIFWCILKKWATKSLPLVIIINSKFCKEWYIFHSIIISHLLKIFLILFIIINTRKTHLKITEQSSYRAILELTDSIKFMQSAFHFLENRSSARHTRRKKTSCNYFPYFFCMNNIFHL